MFYGAFDKRDDPLTMLMYPEDPGIYIYNRDNNGLLPIGMQVHDKNLLHSSLDNLRSNIRHKLSPSQSVNTVGNFAFNKLNSNFIAWQVFPAEDYWGPLKNALAANNLDVLSACPSTYTSCNYDPSSSEPPPPQQPPPADGNSRPQLVNPQPNISWSEGRAHSYTVPANTFSDPDGDVLTYSVKLYDGSNLPAWLNFNPNTRTFTGTPPRNAPNLRLKIRVRDTSQDTVYDDVYLNTP